MALVEKEGCKKQDMGTCQILEKKEVLWISDCGRNICIYIYMHISGRVSILHIKQLIYA